MKNERGKKGIAVKSGAGKAQPLVQSNPFGRYYGLTGFASILILGSLMYANSFNGSFHFDDFPNIVDSNFPPLSDWKGWWQFHQTRVIPFYTFGLNKHFNGQEVWGYHFINLLVHLINSLLVWRLTLLLFQTPSIKTESIAKQKEILALGVGLLFVSHPLATQSVTYIVQRFNSMASMFYLFSVFCYIKARLSNTGKPQRWLLFGGCLLSAICAMLSKENAFTLPFAMVLIELFFLQTRKFSVSFKDYRVILISVGLLIFMGLLIYKYSAYIISTLPEDQVFADRTITPDHYLFTQFGVILKYIQLLIFPFSLNLDYDYKLVIRFFDPRTLLSFFALLSLLVLAKYLFKKHRILSFGICWFFLTLLIESSIIPLQDLIFEHRTYLPSYGFFLLMTCTIYFLVWKRYKSFGMIFFGLIITSYAFLTYERNKVWKDEITLCSDVIFKSPQKARPYTNRGAAFMKQNKLKEAMSDFNKAIELSPKIAKTYYNRGNVYEKEKLYNEAMQDYNTAIQLNPQYYQVYNNRGNIYKYQNETDKAIEDYSEAIKLNPGYYLAYNNRGTIYMIQNKNAEAIEDLSKAVELKPDCAEAFANRGLAELALGNQERSCLDLKKAVDLGFKPAAEALARNCQ